MKLTNRALIALSIAPNVIYVVALLGFMAWRSMSGLPFLPSGATPLVMGLSGVIPLSSVVITNFIRLRRDA